MVKKYNLNKYIKIVIFILLNLLIICSFYILLNLFNDFKKENIIELSINEAQKTTIPTKERIDFNNLDLTEIYSSNVKTDSWSSYESNNGLYSFKYPSNYYYTYKYFTSDGEISENTPIFYKNKEDSDIEDLCVEDMIDPFEKCETERLYDVGRDTNLKNIKQLKENISRNDGNDNFVYYYNDSKNRKWIIIGPGYGLGRYQLNALLVGDNDNILQITVWDNFSEIDSDDEVRSFAQQILDTAVFYN